MDEKMTVQDAIEIMREHIERWYILEQEADINREYNRAQSYADMIYGVKAMIVEIERELYLED